MTRNQAVYRVRDIDLDNEHLLFEEALFHNANGYIGIRSAFEEGYPEEYQSIRGHYINGFYDLVHVRHAEVLHGFVQEKQTMLNVADVQTIRVRFADETFSMFEGEVLESERWVDAIKGVTGRRVRWRSPRGKEVELTIRRMASFHQLALFTIEYDIRSIDFSGEVTIESDHCGQAYNYYDPDDPRIAHPRPSNDPTEYINPVSCTVHNGASYITACTSKSNLHVCTGVKNFLSGEREREYVVEQSSVLCRMRTALEAGERATLIKYTVFADSIRADDPSTQARRDMKEALSVPLQDLYQHQEDYLSEYWENCFVEIEENQDLNVALKYNLFQMIQSVSKDEYGNISPKGLSGEGYEGHYFWDSEMYIQPFFTVTNPDITKRLISNRYNTLGMAKVNARIKGHRKGALYPWRTIMGKECSGYFPAGSAQYHINGDIAHSIIAYYLATGDADFLAEKGAEIIYETARLWMDAGHFQNDRFCINDVTGPDEYTCLVNNNYYTNLLARHHLRWAVKLQEELAEYEAFQEMQKRIAFDSEELDGFSRAADAMVLVYDESLKINPQDDSFLQKEPWDLASIPKSDFPLLLHYHPLHLYRHQVCKQADTVLAHFILEDEQSLETMRHSFDFYERITTHDSSLSECIFSIMAAKLGLPEKAYRYFGNSTHLDLRNLHRNTKDGIHTANIGGNYMAIVYGFAGLRLKESGICFEPMLPEPWPGYRFRIRYRDSRILVQVRDGRCGFYLEYGEPVRLFVYGQEHRLENALTVDMPKEVNHEL